jgi:catechol 2,3-dioxygenase-like lactoylglutathione lyase family enzyme
MITKIRHTGIVVRNLEKAVKFYEALGFKISSRQVETGSFIDQVVGIKNVKVETAKFIAPCSGMLELLQYHSHPVEEEFSKQHSNKLGCSHIALQVEELSETLLVVEKLGGTTPRLPATTSDKQYTVVYCHDPEGNIIEIVKKSKTP